MKPTTDSVQVVLDWEVLGGQHLVGTLHMEATRGTPVFSFEYDAAWLHDHRGVALDPDLALVRGRSWPRPDQPNFGIFLDSAPDRWGRTLLQRRENWRARQDGRKPRVLREWDFLLGVEDVTRLGALRFRRPPDPEYLAHGDGLAVPPIAHLRELVAVAAAIDQGDRDVSQEEEGRWLRQLVAPGSSLGGARPKAVVRDEAGHPRPRTLRSRPLAAGKRVCGGQPPWVACPTVYAWAFGRGLRKRLGTAETNAER